jgi:hypothetical protein
VILKNASSPVLTSSTLGLLCFSVASLVLVSCAAKPPATSPPAALANPNALPSSTQSGPAAPLKSTPPGTASASRTTPPAITTPLKPNASPKPPTTAAAAPRPVAATPAAQQEEKKAPAPTIYETTKTIDRTESYTPKISGD